MKKNLLKTLALSCPLVIGSGLANAEVILVVEPDSTSTGNGNGGSKPNNDRSGEDWTT